MRTIYYKSNADVPVSRKMIRSTAGSTEMTSTVALKSELDSVHTQFQNGEYH